jgi:hypothetical protein
MFEHYVLMSDCMGDSQRHRFGHLSLFFLQEDVVCPVNEADEELTTRHPSLV